MTRGTKYFLLAVGSAVVGWVIGTALVGFAEITHFTSRGTVDMLSASAISAALRDPTFTATLRWGSFELTGMHWISLLPLLIGFFSFVSVLCVAWVRRPKDAP